jgi:hypothetical protein
MATIAELEQQLVELRELNANMIGDLLRLYGAVRQLTLEKSALCEAVLEVSSFARECGDHALDCRDRDIREQLTIRQILIDSGVTTIDEYNHCHGRITHKYDQAKAKHNEQ